VNRRGGLSNSRLTRETSKIDPNMALGRGRERGGSAAAYTPRLSGPHSDRPVAR
jgi:hypothetical protein